MEAKLKNDVSSDEPFGIADRQLYSDVLSLNWDIEKLLKAFLEFKCEFSVARELFINARDFDNLAKISSQYETLELRTETLNEATRSLKTSEAFSKKSIQKHLEEIRSSAQVIIYAVRGLSDSNVFDLDENELSLIETDTIPF